MDAAGGFFLCGGREMRCVSSHRLQKAAGIVCAKTTLGQRGGEGFGITFGANWLFILQARNEGLGRGKEPKRKFPKYHGCCYLLAFHPAEDLGPSGGKRRGPQKGQIQFIL